jgi:hypothetical protein
VPGRGGDVSRKFPGLAHAGKKDPDVWPWHGMVPFRVINSAL